MGTQYIVNGDLGRISYEIHQMYLVWNSPDVSRMKFTRRTSYEIHQTYLVWNSPDVSRMKFTRRISYEIHQTYSLTNGSFISATTSDYFVYFSPHNDKWRKLNWPKWNSHLSQSGENMTTPKYPKLRLTFTWIQKLANINNLYRESIISHLNGLYTKLDATKNCSSQFRRSRLICGTL